MLFFILCKSLLLVYQLDTHFRVKTMWNNIVMRSCPEFWRKDLIFCCLNGALFWICNITYTSYPEKHIFLAAYLFIFLYFGWIYWLSFFVLPVNTPLTDKVSSCCSPYLGGLCFLTCQALEKIPGHERWKIRQLINLAFCHFENGQQDVAMKDLERALQMESHAESDLKVCSKPRGFWRAKRQ